jgi:hypothetical protein
MKSLGAKINQLTGLVGTKDLTKWETEFVNSVGRRTGDGEHTQPLTDNQISKIEQLYDRHFGDG